jgi:hypothetical protein
VLAEGRQSLSSFQRYAPASSAGLTFDAKEDIMHIWTCLIAGVISAKLVTAALGARGQDLSECNAHDEPNHVILACSRIIDDGAVSNDLRSQAYELRSRAYLRRGRTFDEGDESDKAYEDRMRALTDWKQSIAPRGPSEEAGLPPYLVECDPPVPGDLPPPTKDGWQSMAAKDYDSAVEAFTGVIRDCSRTHLDRGRAYLGRAQAYEAKGDKQRADSGFRMARRLLLEFRDGLGMYTWTPDMAKRATEQSLRNMQSIPPN